MTFELSDLESYVNDIENPINFQKAFFRVMKRGTGLVSFNPYPYQQAISTDEAELVVINKSRQTGISTCTVLDKLHEALMDDDYLCIFISLRQDQANELIQKAKSMIDRMRAPYQIPLLKRQESMIQLETADGYGGGRLMAVSANQSAGRGWSADLVLDEFAHVPNDKQILQAAMAVSVREGWRVRMLSTPYGDRGEFCRIVQGIKAGKITNWSLHEIHHSECPDLTMERIMERCPSDDIYQQEYNLQFLDEATAMLSWEVLMGATDLELDQWSEGFAPRSHHSVYLGVDPGEKVNETGFIVTEKVGNRFFVRHVNAEPMSKDVTVEFVKRWKKVIRPVRIYVDETGMGIGVTADLQRDLGKQVVQGVALSNQMKEKLVYNMVGLFEAKQIVIPDHEYLKTQLHALERSKTDILHLSKFTGKVKCKQDDLIWATALSLVDAMLSGPNIKVGVDSLSHQRQRRKKYAIRR